jgi:hypothetical protein
MNTAFLLMAQYGGKAIVPIEDVCRDYFSHLNPTKLVQKISAGEIAIPLVRMEASQKCAKGIQTWPNTLMRESRPPERKWQP